MDVEPTVSSASERTTYELRLKGGGISVERQVTEEQALRVISLVMGNNLGRSVGGGGGPSQKATSSAAGAGASVGHSTVGEYIEEVGARRNADKIAAIGAFLMDSHDMETFTRDDVKGQFQNAGEAPPANFSRDFAVALSNKWLAQPHGVTGQYFVTKTGRTALERQFSMEGRRPAAKSTRRRPRKKAGASGDSD